MKINQDALIGDTNVTLEDLVNKSNELETNIVELQSNTKQLINQKYSGNTSSEFSFTPENGIYFATLWVHAGGLTAPAFYIVVKNQRGAGCICCATAGNAILEVSGTTVKIRAPYGNVVFYNLTRISVNLGA